jgi:hypothetical protein
MSEPLEVRGPGRKARPSRFPLGRAVDRPVFWWSAGAVFLANSGLSMAEDRWGLAVLQVLTCMWAVVAAVTARDPGSSEPTGPATVTTTAPHKPV